MRLGQLARKLEIRQAEIIEFLATKNIHVEDDPNEKVDDNHVALTFQRFSPGSLVENIPDADTPTVSVSEATQAENMLQDPERALAEELSNDVTLPPNEVIKAPKVELSGLKVLGKIDLPDAKKKQVDSPAENSETERLHTSNREKRNLSPRKTQRPSKNPIALQREKEALAAEKKREEERQLKKERRTESYLKKVKAHQPTKAAKLVREETEQMSAAELTEPPKTWLGKFIKWLTT